MTIGPSIIWHQSEFGRAASHCAGWYFELTRRPAQDVTGFAPAVQDDLARFGLVIPELELAPMVKKELGEPTDWWSPLVVSVESARGARPMFDLGPNLLKLAQELPWLSTAKFKATRQGLDALSRYIVVRIDPEWEPRALKESVMAQVAEWLVRVRRHPHAVDLELDSDVWRWWQSWALHTPGSTATTELAEILEIAGRTVRPDHPARQRAYWTKSLRHRRTRPGIVDKAAIVAGIARSTAYDRLRRAGRTVADFENAQNPIRDLAGFLHSAASYHLTNDRHTVINELTAGGMKEASARKLERRIRHLPPEEQVRRVKRALRRWARANGESTIPARK